MGIQPTDNEADGGTERVRTTVSFTKEVHALANDLAQAENRSFNNFLETLVIEAKAQKQQKRAGDLAPA